ncbi:hypothetical protein SAMN02745784_00972 [Tissierella praeacuta DSM 18095]|uniref:DUF2383 domain-containing protein n=1 Tax=Tissierella praeacuta DSM 18095 TaxID=1123404 RepID=A0A1M4U9P6_9FIRM|nr:hypothetical protein [Tissierella praeacuta]SHE53551.1 hypothetical protein SAMN02745784_00972 [Tissierella praeacuta DSM 18095]SUP04076.1 Uncharacterised protein [Tissierella praeacuta]
MDKNVEFLNYIYQNAEMGKNTLSQLIDITEDDNYKELIKSHLITYITIYDNTEKELQEINKKAKGINIFSKSSTSTMINLKTMLNKSTSYISEMLIQGSTMGIIDMTKKLKEYNNVKGYVLSIANELLTFERNSIEEYKKYLQ